MLLLRCRLWQSANQLASVGSSYLDTETTRRDPRWHAFSATADGDALIATARERPGQTSPAPGAMDQEHATYAPGPVEDSMPSGADEMAYLIELDRHITLLGEAIPVLEGAINRPTFINDGRRARFRYERPDERTIQLLMCVRIASGLRAACLLVSYGHIIEAGVILRTVDDFFGDIIFVEEAIAAGPNVVQAQFLHNYFLETTDPGKRHVGRKQKVQAAEGRMLSTDWDTVRGWSAQIDSVYDGIVHGDYSPTMDIYRGGDDPCFEVRGVTGAPPVSTYRHALAQYVHRALNVFGILAIQVGRRDLSATLREARDTLECQPAYTFS
jgi:hypothetical protein